DHGALRLPRVPPGSGESPLGEQLGELVVGKVRDLADAVSLFLKPLQAAKSFDIRVAVEADAALCSGQGERPVAPLPDPERMGRDAGGRGDRADAVAAH